MSVRVLMVEDDQGDATLITALLAEAWEETFDVSVVNRLSKAKEMVSKDRFDVILLDLGLPDSRGLDTLTEALEFAKGTPIVVLTGNRAEGLGTEVTKMGAQDYLVKGDANADAVERSLIYAIERKKAHDAIRDALQSYADLVREIPSGLLTFQFEGPGDLRLLSWNPKAENILARNNVLQVGMDIGDIWPLDLLPRDEIYDVIRSGEPHNQKGERFARDGREMVIDLRVFRIPGHRLCISLDDVTELVREEELRKMACSQIERNIEHFASLVDEIRNPNSVIIGVAERLDGKASRCILLQAERIERIVNRLDEQWAASEDLRRFLNRPTAPQPLD